MIGERLVRRFGPERPVDALTPPELRARLVDCALKRSPALHDEIEAVLREAGHPLPADVIANRIRARGTTPLPRSLQPWAGSNVNSRVANATYRSRIVRRDDGIWLTTSEGESAG
jgi:hypothetical protein